MPMDRADIESALLRKLGFAQQERDHRVFILRIGNRVIARTMVSRGAGYRTIGDPLVRQMAKQLHVPRRFFEELVRCARTRGEYMERLTDRGIISEDEQ